MSTIDCGMRPCPDNPADPSCKGHRVTKRLTEVADIICWAETGVGLDDEFCIEDPSEREGFLRRALEYLREDA